MPSSLSFPADASACSQQVVLETAPEIAYVSILAAPGPSMPVLASGAGSTEIFSALGVALFVNGRISPIPVLHRMGTPSELLGILSRPG